MAKNCTKLSTDAIIARAEKKAGRTMTPTERASLALAPPEYVCSGDGVASLRTRKSRTRKSPRKRR